MCVYTETHTHTPTRTIAVATATISECVKAALLPNLAAGKTEAALCLYGRQSEKTAAEIFQGAEPSLQLSSPVWPQARLRLVTSVAVQTCWRPNPSWWGTR